MPPKEKPDQPQEKTLETRRITRTEPRAGKLFTYANNVEVGQTGFDVRLAFGELSKATEEEIEVEQRVQVTISWLQAKLLARLLTRVVEHYENTNGPLKLPVPAEVKEKSPIPPSEKKD